MCSRALGLVLGTWRLLPVSALRTRSATWRTGFFNSDLPSQGPWLWAGIRMTLLQSLRTRATFSTFAIQARYTPVLNAASSATRGACSMFKAPFLNLSHPWLCMQARTVVKHSKLGKMKTVKAVAKRFRRTGSGKLKFWPPGNVHNLLSKSHNYRRRVRKARYVSKTQLKTLNKMLIGKWS